MTIPPQVIVAPIQPEFLRLPKPGLLCPFTGMTRSALNELILPTERNSFKPPVRSFVLRQRGAKTGIRLVDYAHLSKFIRQHPQEAGNPVHEEKEVA
ncbi:MAG: hypothetical protein HZA90_06170 [Verrucomicrobia bacterium]|nr:hypothetical protein [Verrucomicrobiota bacterium]